MRDYVSARWNWMIFSVAVLGSLFIMLTRVQPQSSLAVQPAAPAAARPAPLVGHPAPDFTLTALDGSTVTLSRLRGKVILLNVWATWCPPCRAEMPTIQAVYDQYRDQGFIVLTINQAEDVRTVAAFLQQNKLSLPTLMDVDNSVGQLYQTTLLPTSFFVDKQGIIRTVYRGPMARSVIAGTVEQLLREGS